MHLRAVGDGPVIFAGDDQPSFRFRWIAPRTLHPAIALQFPEADTTVEEGQRMFTLMEEAKQPGRELAGEVVQR